MIEPEMKASQNMGLSTISLMQASSIEKEESKITEQSKKPDEIENNTQNGYQNAKYPTLEPIQEKTPQENSVEDKKEEPPVIKNASQEEKKISDRNSDEASAAANDNKRYRSLVGAQDIDNPLGKVEPVKMPEVDDSIIINPNQIITNPFKKVESDPKDDYSRIIGGEALKEEEGGMLGSRIRKIISNDSLVKIKYKDYLNSKRVKLIVSCLIV